VENFYTGGQFFELLDRKPGQMPRWCTRQTIGPLLVAPQVRFPAGFFFFFSENIRPAFFTFFKEKRKKKGAGNRIDPGGNSENNSFSIFIQSKKPFILLHKNKKKNLSKCLKQKKNVRISLIHKKKKCLNV
jgi:hypothetical protein